MPELPEAETIARGLQSLLPGKMIRAVHVLWSDVLAMRADAFRAALRNKRIQRVHRRGKKVVLVLEEGTRLVVSLGMTGRLLALLPDVPTPPARATHPAVRFFFEGGGTLLYDDVRRFGTLECLSAEAWDARSRTLGPEPLSSAFTARKLAQGLAHSITPVRSWLLDQRRVAGVGNIYASEALWRARVHPVRPARTLTGREAGRLHRSLRRVLREAVEGRGTTLRDYRTAEGEPGSFSLSLSVYGREGSGCPRCSTPVERIVFANRSAFLCPRCQPAAHVSP